MDTITLARVFHVLAVILLIGGVGMVTTIIIPAVKGLKSREDQFSSVEGIEGRFALWAKS